MACLDETTVVRFLQGRLGESAASRIEEHLDACADCHRLVGLLAAADLIAGAPRPTDDGAGPSLDTLPRPGRPSRPPPPEIGPGERLGRYRVLDLLGVGGMGAVYAAADPELDRRVALKVMHPRLLADLDPEDARRRLLREGKALAALSHPNVIAVYDVGVFGEQVFLAMELVEGKALDAWLRQEARPWREVLRVFLAAGRGLAAAHAAGIVHRDFKPENVLVGDDGRIRVTDFGLARQRAESEAETSPDAAAPAPGAAAIPPGASWTLTGSGVVAGTPRYMAPEQHHGAPPDARTDQFSFCVALHEALHGEHPFPAGTQGAVGVLPGPDEAARMPARSRVPTWIQRAVARGLRASPQARWPTMDALLSALAADPAAARRRWLVAAALASMVAALVVTTALAARDERPICSGAARQLDGVWDPPRRGAVRASFLATGKPFALDAFHAVAAGLDRYARAWVLAHQEACTATRLRGEQSEAMLDLRMACLDQRRIALRAIAQELANADPKLVARGLRVVEALPAMGLCAKPAALSGQEQAPAGSEARREMRAVRAGLARAVALREAGRYAEGLTLAKRAAEAAAGIGYRPLQAQALLVRGTLERRAGQHRHAVETLHTAAVAAQAGGEQEVAAGAWIELAGLVGHTLAREEEGRRWAAYARAALHRLGGDAVLAARLLHQEANIASFFGRQAEAQRTMRRALALQERHLGAAHPRVADTLNALGIIAGRSGRYREATELFRRAMAIHRQALGPHHPSVASDLNNLGIVYRLEGRLEEALATQQEVLALAKAALGPEHAEIADSLNNIGNVLDQLGRYEESAAAHRRALAIRERAYGPEHPRVAVSLGNLALALAQLGRFQEALRLHRRELAIGRKRFGPGSRRVGRTLDNIGTVLRRLGRTAEAEAHHTRALAIVEKAQGADHPDVASSLYNLGVALAVRGRLAEARRRHERALRIREKGLGPLHPLVGESLRGLAEIARRRGRGARAVALAERALAIREGRKGSPAELAGARFALARALRSAGRNPARARQLASEALQGYAAAGPGYRARQDELKRWLRVGEGR